MATRSGAVAGAWFFPASRFCCTLGGLAGFRPHLGTVEADDRWQPLSRLLRRDKPLFVIDQFSAPLLPWLALLYFLTAVTTLQAKMRRFSFSWTLVSEA